MTSHTTLTSAPSRCTAQDLSTASSKLTLDKAPPTNLSPTSQPRFGAPLQTDTVNPHPSNNLTTPALDMSLDPPTYLSSLRNNIRARPIPWDGAVRAGTITEEQLTRIRAVDKVRKEQRKRTVEEELDAYKTLFLGGGEGAARSILEAAARRADVVQYVLVLLGDLLQGMLTFRSFARGG